MLTEHLDVKSSAVMDESIFARYYAGESPTNLCKELSITTTTFYNHLKKRGLPNRNGRRKLSNDSFFKRIDTEEKAYWLGFIVADGCVQSKRFGSSNNCVSISLAKKDEAHLTKFLTSICSNTPITQTVENSHNIVKVGIYSLEMVEDLIALGVTVRKSATATVPDIPPELLPHFYRGLFDGDGGVGEHIYFCGASPLVLEFKHWLELNGLQNIRHYEYTYPHRLTLHRLAICNNADKRRFYELMVTESEYKMNRKWNIMEGLQ